MPTARRISRRAIGAFAALFLGATLLAPPAAAIPASEVQSQQWWITRLGLRDVWKISQGKGTTVAVMEKGVDAKFGDLRDAMVPGFAVGVPGSGATDPTSDEHGTVIASYIAGRGTGFGMLGVARQAKIMPVAIDESDDDTIAAALNRLSSMSDPPDVVNMSFGGDHPCYTDVQAAVTKAVRKGMILVASAGNTGNRGNLSQSPASCTGVVAVGAVDANTRAWSGSQRQPYVSLSAPGVKMIAYADEYKAGYGYTSGTSDSAAIVSGSFAVLRAKFPKSSARDLVTRMLYTARQFSGKQGTRNDTYGYGVARPHHALTDSVPADAPNPVYDKLGSSGSPSGSSAPTGSSGPAPSDVASPGRTSDPQAGNESDSGSNTGVIIGVVVAAIVVIALIAVVLARRGRRPAGPPPPHRG